VLPLSLVVFLRGINVGGHRRLRPTALAAELDHLDVVSIGSTGTFVLRAPVGRRQVRNEIAMHLPFPCDIAICDGRDVSRLVSQDPFGGRRIGPGIVRFVGILSRVPRGTPELPIALPARGRWLVKILTRQGRFIVGLHRREMKVIGALADLDGVFGARATIRSWNTMSRIGNVLSSDDDP
jgi:uncharacterized protein (DUF1697 family)